MFKNMKRQWLGYAFVMAVALAGCAATVSGEAYGPDLAYVAPGVQVIADYDEPIFYSDGYYWRPHGNAWYRSPHYAGGWVYAAPPPAILRIERPYGYVHYRPQGWHGQGHGYVARPAPPPHAGWRGSYAATPPPRPPAAGWRGAPPPPVAHPAAPARPAPQQQGRPAPKHHGWR